MEEYQAATQKRESGFADEEKTAGKEVGSQYVS